MNARSLKQVEDEFRSLFSNLARLQKEIKKRLTLHSDGKALKGDEVVGWVGEIYGKYFLEGRLVDDSFEHDLEAAGGLRVSIKTRKGHGTGWNRSSAIPRIDGENCPTHLLFIRLSADYLVEKIWLYPWDDLLANDRFRKHIVRGHMRSYYFLVNEHRDADYAVYDGCS